MDEKLVGEYLRRIGVARPHSAGAGALRSLHQAHLLAVPFENLSIHLAEPISLTEGDLIDKVVNRRRGGFCYELNGAFALLLQAIGFDVRLVAARVYGDGQLGPPFDHLALVVRAADGSGPWLADVGFGSHSTYPLLLDSRQQQEDPAGRFLIDETTDGDLDVLRDTAGGSGGSSARSSSEPRYRIELRERMLGDFVPTCWWQQTSPQSHFTRSVICSRLTEDGRISISGRTLIRTTGGARTEDQLADTDAVLAAYHEHFGIELDREPEVARAA